MDPPPPVPQEHHQEEGDGVAQRPLQQQQQEPNASEPERTSKRRRRNRDAQERKSTGSFVAVDPNGSLIGRRCLVEYDGTSFHGFQAQEQRQQQHQPQKNKKKQKNQEELRTIQETIENAILRTTNETLRIRFASRTDKGVHAKGQVIAFDSRCCMEDDVAFCEAINNRLPAEIVLKDMTRTETIGFEPRTGSVAKTYCYKIVNGPLREVFKRHFAWYVKKPLDVAKMQQAAHCFVGSPKDFASFTPQPKGRQELNTICCLSRLHITSEPLDGSSSESDNESDLPGEAGEQNQVKRRNVLIRVTVKGDRFLYKMVRNLVGTLVDVGHGKIPVESVPLILQAGNRAQAGQGAPPHGLVLSRVHFQ